MTACKSHKRAWIFSRACLSSRYLMNLNQLFTLASKYNYMNLLNPVATHTRQVSSFLVLGSLPRSRQNVNTTAQRLRFDGEVKTIKAIGLCWTANVVLHGSKVVLIAYPMLGQRCGVWSKAFRVILIVTLNTQARINVLFWSSARLSVIFSLYQTTASLFLTFSVLYSCLLMFWYTEFPTPWL